MSHCCGSIRSSGGSAGQTGAPGSGLPPGVLDRDLLVWDDALQLWVPTQVTERLHYSFGTVSVSTTTFWLYPWYTPTAAAATEVLAGSLQILADGTLGGLRATHTSPVGADDLVYTLVRESVDTLFTITLNSGSVKGSNLAATLSVVAGDRIAWRCSGATAGRTVRCSIQFWLRTLL